MASWTDQVSESSTQHGQDSYPYILVLAAYSGHAEGGVVHDTSLRTGREILVVLQRVPKVGNVVITESINSPTSENMGIQTRA